MNDTKYIYENYRKNIIGDKLATAILSDLYLNLPQTEEELVSKFSNHNIHLKLAELFKSSMLIQGVNNTWKISELGKMILLKSDIAQVIVNYQLEKLKLNNTDKYFLISCIKTQTHFAENYINLVSSYIKTLTKSIQNENYSVKKKQELTKDGLYAFIVGLDHNIRSVGSENYPEFIFSTLENIDNEKWVQNRIRFKLQREYITFNCNMADLNAKQSNLCFYEPKRISFNETNIVVKKLVATRLVNVLINNEIDNDVKLFIMYKKEKDIKMLQDVISRELINWRTNYSKYLNNESLNFSDKIKSEMAKSLNTFSVIKDKHLNKKVFYNNIDSLLSENYLKNLNDKEINDLSNYLVKITEKLQLYLEKRKLQT